MRKNNTSFLLKCIPAVFCLLTGGNIFAQKDTLRFLHITDLHVIFTPYAYIPEMMEYREKKEYHLGETRLRQFLETVPERTNSDEVIATGDLVDFFETETADGSTLSIQPEQFSKFLGGYKIPVWLTLGNHDIFTFGWDESLDYKLQHNHNYANRARALWIRNEPCFKNGTYYSKITRVGQTTYRLIFLDDSFYEFSKDDKTSIPYIDKSQLYWLNTELHESDNDIEIILTHIPFMEKVAELEVPNEFYTALAKNPTCKLILAGHQHKNVVLKFPAEGGNEIVQVQTAALVKNPEEWRLITLTENNISVSFPGKTEKEVVIPVK